MGLYDRLTFDMARTFIFLISFLTFAASYAAAAINCDCSVWVGTQLFEPLDALKSSQYDNCTFEAEDECEEECRQTAEQFEEQNNYTSPYPNDPQSRTYGAVWCERIQVGLGERYEANVWGINAEALLDGEECPYDGFWQLAWVFRDFLCCDEVGDHDPECEFNV